MQMKVMAANLNACSLFSVELLYISISLFFLPSSAIIQKLLTIIWTPDKAEKIK